MADTAAAAFSRLVDIVARLRAPDGCPWDREQTLETLRPFVLEETYEVLEAIDRGDLAALREEIGDMIFEGVLLAQVCAEAGRLHRGRLGGVDRGQARAPPPARVRRRGQGAHAPTRSWAAGRRRRRASATAAAAGRRSRRRSSAACPKTLPALLRAHEMGTRAAAVGFDWERATDVLAKIEEEVAELREAVEADGGATRDGRVEEEMGDLLFAIANLSRKLGVEPESALRKADDKFARRFTELERRFAARGESLQGRRPRADGRRVGPHQGRRDGLILPATTPPAGCRSVAAPCGS